MNLVELEPSAINFNPPADSRPTIPEPLPVRLIAIGDVRADAVAGTEVAMDEIYVKVLEFQRVPQPVDAHRITYQADNARLNFTVKEPTFARDDFRPIQIEVLSLAVLSNKLIEREIEFTRQKSIIPGQESVVFQDPSANFVEVTERKKIV
jgi:hypothetical protein